MVALQGLSLPLAARKTTITSLTAYRPYQLEGMSLSDHLAASRDYSDGFPNLPG